MTRLTWNISHSSRSEGMRDLAVHAPALISLRISSISCAYSGTGVARSSVVLMSDADEVCGEASAAGV